MKLSCKKKN